MVVPSIDPISLLFLGPMSIVSVIMIDVYKCTLPSVHGNYDVKQCKKMSNWRTAFSTGMWDWNMEGNWKTRGWETEREREQEMGTYNYLRESLQFSLLHA